MKDIEIKVTSTRNEHIIEVSLPQRIFAKDEKISFSDDDAENFLRKKKLKFSKISSGFNMILRNYGDYPSVGKYTFTRSDKPTKTRTRNPKTKTQPKIQEKE
jgi:hypothetical protein